MESQSLKYERSMLNDQVASHRMAEIDPLHRTPMTQFDVFYLQHLSKRPKWNLN
jgi:hypothetical protein